jgi:hypothetical protein
MCALVDAVMTVEPAALERELRALPLRLGARAVSAAGIRAARHASKKRLSLAWAAPPPPAHTDSPRGIARNGKLNALVAATHFRAPELEALRAVFVEKCGGDASRALMSDAQLRELLFGLGIDGLPPDVRHDMSRHTTSYDAESTACRPTSVRSSTVTVTHCEIARRPRQLLTRVCCPWCKRRGEILT